MQVEFLYRLYGFLPRKNIGFPTDDRCCPIDHTCAWIWTHIMVCAHSQQVNRWCCSFLRANRVIPEVWTSCIRLQKMRLVLCYSNFSHWKNNLRVPSRVTTVRKELLWVATNSDWLSSIYDISVNRFKATGNFQPNPNLPPRQIMNS
jgi:hypothetical protein